MKLPTRVLVQCGILLCVLALAAFAGQDPGSSALRTEVHVQRASEGVFVLAARVTDLASGNVLAMPTLKVPAGQEASAESTLEGGKAQVHFSGKVDPAHHTATYSVRLEREGKVLSEHAAAVALQ